MKAKRFITSAFMAVMLAAVTAGLAGCRKKDVQADQADLSPIGFGEEEAFRIGDYRVGIDMFMLYAIDAVPLFVNQFGEDCWMLESIDLNWRTEAPKKAFILYLTDIIASAIACDIYYGSTKGELEDSVKSICSNIAHERYEALINAGMPEGVVTEESIYEYTCSTYRLSYVMKELSEKYEEDTELIQAAVLGMRDSIDETFDYDRNINWDLVESIDYSLASANNAGHISE